MDPLKTDYIFPCAQESNDALNEHVLGFFNIDEYLSSTI